MCDDDRWGRLRGSVKGMLPPSTPRPSNDFGRGCDFALQLVLDEMVTIELAEPAVPDGV